MIAVIVAVVVSLTGEIVWAMQNVMSDEFTVTLWVNEFLSAVGR